LLYDEIVNIADYLLINLYIPYNSKVVLPIELLFYAALGSAKVILYVILITTYTYLYVSNVL